MANFLIFSGIGPSKRFIGCLPIRVGVFFVFLLHVAVLVVDLLEHQRFFDDDEKDIINRWITFSVQCAISLLIFICLLIRHQLLSMITYFILLIGTVAMACEKLMKVLFIYHHYKLLASLLKINTMDYALLYAYRSLAELFIYFYCTYVVYSYSMEGVTEDYNTREKFVK